jgi:hypothetical protein
MKPTISKPLWPARSTYRLPVLLRPKCLGFTDDLDEIAPIDEDASLPAPVLGAVLNAQSQIVHGYSASTRRSRNGTVLIHLGTVKAR